jgi:hypothetical protein
MDRRTVGHQATLPELNFDLISLNPFGVWMGMNR